MKIFVKTLKGSHFEIEVNPEDTVTDLKKNIEKVQGSDVYPASQQMLIHQGKVLKDETTLVENSVADKSFVVIMLTKTKGSSSGAAPVSAAPSSTVNMSDVSSSGAQHVDPKIQAQTPASSQGGGKPLLVVVMRPHAEDATLEKGIDESEEDDEAGKGEGKGVEEEEDNEE